MSSSIASLSQQLFSFQREYQSASQRASLESALDRVLEERLRPLLLGSLGGTAAAEVIAAVRTEFLRHAGSIQASEVGRFIHSAVHSCIAARLPAPPPAQPEAQRRKAFRDMLETHEPAEVLARYCAMLGASPAETARALGQESSAVIKLLEGSAQ